MEEKIKRVVESIEALLHGSMAPSLGDGFSPLGTASQWVSQIRANTMADDEGNRFAPDHHILHVHPDDYLALTKSGLDLQSSIAEPLRQVVEDAGYKVLGKLRITLAVDPNVARSVPQAIASHSRNPLKQARSLPSQESSAEQPPPGAYFLIDGKDYFPLREPLVTIGRRIDNHLVLNDPLVSRRHALLRLREGHYVLVDLDSSGGTQVNGRLVEECVLRRSDVVVIGTVKLIYGEDPAGPSGVASPYKRPLKPPPDHDERTPLDLHTGRSPSPEAEEGEDGQTPQP